MARVLVIDDDEAVAALLRSVLSEAGHEVVTSPHVRSAAAVSPDVVISDLELPGGYDAAAAREHVSAVAREFGRPVVVCTAHREAAAEQDKLGADEVIAKPFDLEAVLRAVQRLAG
jgi:CheY-like chemotaxis protein